MRLTRPLCCVTKKIGDLTKKYANLPESYIKRATEQVEWKTPDLPQYLPREIKRRNWRFTTNRPWTDEFKSQQEVNTAFVPIEPIKEWTIFRGDRVEVLVGRDKGKQGIVAQIIQERNWVIVTGLNTHYRRVGKTATYPGMAIRSEAPLLVTTQVSLVDPSDSKISKAEWRYMEDGERVRVSIRTGRIIPMPMAAEETFDYKNAASYVENKKKDTPKNLVEAITFEPKLKTFEMDVMDDMGIVETREPKKSYWY